MEAPTTSVAYGSAGLAYGLCRLACVHGDGELLALADAWCERSLRTSSQDSAFWNDELDVTAEWVGPQSLHHGPLGVYVVAALTASARSDGRSQDLALDRFLELARQPGRFLDLVGGLAGALLGCALLWDAEPARRPDLSEAAGGLLRLLQERFAGYRPIGTSPELPYLGIAHGWAGLLYAAITWLLVSGQECPDALVNRLEELAALGRPTGRGLQWSRRVPASTDDQAFAASWCNGSAGYVFLWTQAHRVTRDSRYLELAEGAAWHTWEGGTPNPNLCCGMAGRAYALLNFYRACGDASWLRRAEGIMEDAAAVVDLPDAKNLRDHWRIGSLYKGDVALALLATDLLRPEDARMPLFEPEA
jgi:eukaryotic-like serine/threonine-protein kinase